MKIKILPTPPRTLRFYRTLPHCDRQFLSLACAIVIPFSLKLATDEEVWEVWEEEKS